MTCIATVRSGNKEQCSIAKCLGLSSKTVLTSFGNQHCCVTLGKHGLSKSISCVINFFRSSTTNHQFIHNDLSEHSFQMCFYSFKSCVTNHWSIHYLNLCSRHLLLLTFAAQFELKSGAKCTNNFGVNRNFPNLQLLTLHGNLAMLLGQIHYQQNKNALKHHQINIHSNAKQHLS